MRLRPRQRMLIRSAWLVRALAGSGRWHHCRDCGSRMFVKGPSGLCPVCLTRERRRHKRIQEIVGRQADAAVQDWGAEA